jgi:hypothetical protein
MSQFLQQDQYDKQGMFGTPVSMNDKMAVFHSVWTYAIKVLDSCKKARWACHGSPTSGQAKILDETYANCIDQTSSRLFYAISVAENLLIFGADVFNTIAEAPPPKQGFYTHPNRAFSEWWVNHKKRPPIAQHGDTTVGHARPSGISMAVGKACICNSTGMWSCCYNSQTILYSGLIQDKRVILKQQVDDFAIAAPDK